MTGTNPFPAALDERRLGEAAAMFASRTVRKGELLFEVGGPAESMWLLCKGRIQLFVDNNLGDRVILAEPGPGDLFGEAGALDGKSNPYSAMALSDSRVSILRKEDLVELLGRYPETSMAMMTALCRQLRVATSQLGGSTPSLLDDRIAQDRPPGVFLAERLVAVAGSSLFFIIALLTFACMIVFSAFGIPMLSGPLDEDLSSVDCLVATLAAVQSLVILMVLSRSANRTRIKDEIDLRFEDRAEASLLQINNSMEANQQELRQLLAETRALLAGSPAPTRDPT